MSKVVYEHKKVHADHHQIVEVCDAMSVEGWEVAFIVAPRFDYGTAIYFRRPKADAPTQP